MANQNILQRAQVKGTTQTIKSYAGIDGQLIVNETTGDLHIMSGVAGSNKVLPCKQTVSQMIQTQTPAPDLSEYLTKNDASNTYLNKTAASNSYLNKTDASNTYLSKAAASDTYLNKTDASDTYLNKTDASDTYLNKTDASNTYLNKKSKAQSAKVADNANSVLGSNVNGAVSQATHASSADNANSVPWSGVSNKPTIPSMWSYGTGDLTAGSSPLETGKLHFVYE